MARTASELKAVRQAEMDRFFRIAPNLPRASEGYLREPRRRRHILRSINTSEEYGSVGRGSQHADGRAILNKLSKGTSISRLPSDASPPNTYIVAPFTPGRNQTVALASPNEIRKAFSRPIGPQFTGREGSLPVAAPVSLCSYFFAISDAASQFGCMVISSRPTICRKSRGPS